MNTKKTAYRRPNSWPRSFIRWPKMAVRRNMGHNNFPQDATAFKSPNRNFLWSLKPDGTLFWYLWVTIEHGKVFKPIRTTCRLVRWNVVSFIEPMRESVRKNSLMCKFVMLNCQSLILISLTIEHFMTLTNQKFC